VVREVQMAKFEFAGAQMKFMAYCLARAWIRHWSELEELGREPDGLFPLLFVNRGPATKLLEIAAVGCFEQHSTVSQHLTWHLEQPGREFGLEMAVLLINRCEMARQGQAASGKSSEVLILAHLGVVDEALTTNPAQQGLSLCVRRVAAVAVTNLCHDSKCSWGAHCNYMALFSIRMVFDLHEGGCLNEINNL
jgi:hypothetical protein